MKLRFLIASGPTREPIDPVRFLSNYSTGVMGRCLVEAAKARGHVVDFVECPHDAETARDLERTLKARLSQADVLIMAAAVCDARPKKLATKKIKKEDLGTIYLVKNPDILAGLAKMKKKNQIFIGFALESKDVFKNALKKLNKKSLDLILLQRVTDKIKPFGNRALDAFLIKSDHSQKALKSISKIRLAKILVCEAEQLALGRG